MGIASLVIGIVSVILGFIPCVGQIAFVPSIVGIVLGAIGISKAKKAQPPQPTGSAIAGLVLNIVAIVVILLWNLVFAAASAAAESGY